MVSVTAQAANALEAVLSENAAPPEAGVRLTPNPAGNLGVMIEVPHDGDEVITRDDTPLLIVDGAVTAGLTDMVLDYHDGADDHQTPTGFVLRKKLPSE